MSFGQNPSDSLASILATLSQSSQKRSGLPSAATSVHHPPPEQLQRLEPVFTESDILDTTLWIGAANTIPWYEPRSWQFPRPARHRDTIRKPSRELHPSLSLSANSPRSFTPEPKPPLPAAIPNSASTANYSQALKHVIRLSQSEQFIEAIKRMKREQHDLETDLFEERSRIKRKWDSKRKMDKILLSIGSQCIGEEVSSRSCFADTGVGQTRVCRAEDI